MQTHQYDAIIVGAGGAGLMAALYASKGGANYIGWANGGRTLTWAMGPVLYRADVAALFPAAPRAENAPKFAAPESGIPPGTDVEDAAG